MIRDFEAKDIEQFNKLLQSLETKSLIGELNKINKRVSKLIVYERENQLKGLAYTIISVSVSGDHEAQVLRGLAQPLITIPSNLSSYVPLYSWEY